MNPAAIRQARERAEALLAGIAEARRCEAEAGWYGFVSLGEVENGAADVPRLCDALELALAALEDISDDAEILEVRAIAAAALSGVAGVLAEGQE
jgi:hypothetical protein